jgi:hypothetical protein
VAVAAAREKGDAPWARYRRQEIGRLRRRARRRVLAIGRVRTVSASTVVPAASRARQCAAVLRPQGLEETTTSAETPPIVGVATRVVPVRDGCGRPSQADALPMESRTLPPGQAGDTRTAGENGRPGSAATVGSGQGTGMSSGPAVVTVHGAVKAVPRTRRDGRTRSGPAWNALSQPQAFGLIFRPSQARFCRRRRVGGAA